MSFDQLSSLEAGSGGGGRQGRRSNGGASSRSPVGPYQDDPEFSRLTTTLMNQLFRLTGNNARLQTEIGHLSTRRDTARVRERVHDLLEESRALFKEVGEGVKKVQVWEDVTPTQKYTQQKLSREFQSTLAEFQTLQRTALEKERASVSVARASLHAHEEASGAAGDQEQVPLQQQQQQVSRLAAQDEVEFQEALIIEREEEIRNIEQGVGDLNVLFQQVAQIVSEQGEQLTTIADNVENVRADTRGADYELRAAARYQRNARSKACCLLLILTVILTIVLLAVFLG